LIEKSRQDAGNLGYDIQPDALNEGVFLAQERWQDQPSLDAHLAQPHFQKFASAIEPWLAGPMALHKIML
ncbi:MAG: putative quinol monooxygenase, partial [Victivallaceae bacterium]|nr:putative quinol monooxygenase [Victivallaceae bacterium]